MTLWGVLAAAYERLGFEVLGDEAFRSLVLARVVEPTSKADTARVLADIGVPAPSLRTIFRALGRTIGRDYRLFPIEGVGPDFAVVGASVRG